MFRHIVSLTFLAICCSGFLISRDVCYSDLGCFQTSQFRSLKRPVVLLPNSPDSINTTFLLYTLNEAKPSTLVEQQLTYDETTIKNSKYNPSLPTKVIVHGYTHDAHQPWVTTMISQLLSIEKMNVIAVDWSIGAKFPYTQATGNSMLVGAQIAKLINLLIEVTGQASSSFHLIGHSLGSHVAGYTGARVKGLGRITGLDPAQAYFEGTETNVRLDDSDAMFVDVIHTDGSSLVTNLGTGLMEVSGHVDFYPNGGSNQPGCDQKLSSKLFSTLVSGVTAGYDGMEDTITCSTMASVAYFLESISTSCPFTAYQCLSYEHFAVGLCLECAEDGSYCTKMGYHANPSARGSHYLHTQSSHPFCGYHYSIIATAAKMTKTTYGTLKVEIRTSDGPIGPFTLTDTKGEPTGVIGTGETLSALVVVEQPLGELQLAIITYQKGSCTVSCFLYAEGVKLAEVAVQSGEQGTRTAFCNSNFSIDNNMYKTLSPAPEPYC